MRIAFFIASLSAGGAERVASLLCNTWSAAHDVELLTLQREDDPVYYPLSARVSVTHLGLRKNSTGPLSLLANNVERIRGVRRWLSHVRPDVLVCFMTEPNVVGVIAALGLGVPVVISERIHPGHHPVPRVQSFARRLVYPRADALTVQTEDIAEWYRDHLGLPSTRIPNPIELVPEGTLEFPTRSEKAGNPCLLGVGRLEPQKGFDLLIEAFARVAGHHPDWILQILGEGGARSDLQDLVDSRGLGERVLLPGVSDDVFSHLKSATVFVHPARYEGYPNAVMEALAAGRCVVATDAPGATRELLQGGHYGLLARTEDVDDLAQCLERAMSDAALRAIYEARARDAVRALAAPRIAERWITLFGEVIGRC